MVILYRGQANKIRLSIYKGQSEALENFDRAMLKVWLVGRCDQIPLEYEIKKGKIEAVIPVGLACGVWSVKAIWLKNKWRQDGCCGHKPLAVCGGIPQSLNYAFVGNVFASSNIQSEATYLGGDKVLEIKTNVASYGYDGLSAYELAVITGKTTLTMDEWVANLAEMNETLAKEIAGMKDMIEGDLAEFMSELKEQHVSLSASAYAQLAKENKIDDKVLYGIIDGQRIKTLYFGKLPYVPNNDVYVISVEPQAWNLKAEVSATQITSAETRITLGGSATRIEVYTFSDGTISSAEVTGVVRWSTNVGSISNNTLIIPQTASERTIKVTASIGEGSDKVVKEFTIKQSAPASISLNTTVAEIGSEGGTVEIAYTVNGDVGEIKVRDDYHSGVVGTVNGNKVSGTITFEIPALSEDYISEEPVSRNFTIYGEYGGEATLIIKQVPSGSLSVSDKTLEENVNEFSVVVNRKSDSSNLYLYSVACREDNGLSVVNSSKTASNTFAFKLPVNDSSVIRHWYITIKSDKGNSTTCVVTQPVAISRSIKFASGDVEVASNIGKDGGEYEAMIVISNLGDGVPVVQGASYDRNIIESASIITKNDNYCLKYKVKANTTYVARQTPIVIEMSYGGKMYTSALAVKQAEAIKEETLYKIYYGTRSTSPASNAIDASEVQGGNSITVKDADLPKELSSNTTAKCKWYAIPSNLQFFVKNDMGWSETWDTQNVTTEGQEYVIYYTYSALASSTEYTITIK